MANSVKRIFGLIFGLGSGSKYQQQNNGIPQPIGGSTVLSKVPETCHSPHLAGIQEIKRISQSPLQGEIDAF